MTASLTSPSRLRGGLRVRAGDRGRAAGRVVVDVDHYPSRHVARQGADLLDGLVKNLGLLVLPGVLVVGRHLGDDLVGELDGLPEARQCRTPGEVVPDRGASGLKRRRG